MSTRTWNVYYNLEIKRDAQYRPRWVTITQVPKKGASFRATVAAHFEDDEVCIATALCNPIDVESGAVSNKLGIVIATGRLESKRYCKARIKRGNKYQVICSEGRSHLNGGDQASFNTFGEAVLFDIAKHRMGVEAAYVPIEVKRSL